MKMFTKEEYNDLPCDKFGIKHCPSGDYTAIKFFEDASIFDSHCKFGAASIFYASCIFGEECEFGPKCIFHNECHFYSRCKFDACCSFGKCSSFANNCHFNDCSFGVGCYFAAGCDFDYAYNFGERCDFFSGCRCEFGEFIGLLTCGGYGSEGRTTYFFVMSDGRIMVRCGCFAGGLDAWADKVRETYAGDDLCGVAYLAQIPSVKAQAAYIKKMKG